MWIFSENEERIFLSIVPIEIDVILSSRSIAIFIIIRGQWGGTIMVLAVN